jgi:hypothetical protein
MKLGGSLTNDDIGSICLMKMLLLPFYKWPAENEYNFFLNP